MSIPIQCGSCGQKLLAPIKFAGRQVACPKCKAAIKVPSQGSDARPVLVADVAPEPSRPMSAAPVSLLMPPLPGRLPTATAVAVPEPQANVVGTPIPTFSSAQATTAAPMALPPPLRQRESTSFRQAIGH